MHIRREQILEAVEKSITKNGLAGTTLSRIAESAGVQQSLIAHYFGNKEAVISAAVERTLGNFRAGFEETLRGVPPARQLATLMDVLFGGAMTDRRFGLMVDVLIADSYFSTTTRAAVRALYEDFQRMLRQAVDASYPRAPAADRAAVAYGLLCLADANNTFLCIGFGPPRPDLARSLADSLIATLRKRER
jgi:AcrR family transcriptional regulator